MSSPDKVLIVLLGAIGDVARALPMAVRLKAHWPQTTLHWAVEPISKSLVEQHPAIDRVHVFERPKGFPAYLRFLAELRKERFDLVLDMQRHLKSGVSSWATRAPRRLSFHRRNSREGNWLFNTEQVAPAQHLSSKAIQFQAFGDALGLPPMPQLKFGLDPREDERAQFEEKLSAISKRTDITPPEPAKRVAFILGSTWPSRFWTVEHYKTLARGLSEQYGFTPLLIGGPRERQFADAIREGLTVPALDLVEQTTLRELAVVFSSCRFAVGSDSGPMHIAAAVDTPVISLWGSTSPERSAPVGSEQYVLQSPIGCSPCYRCRCPGLSTRCMKDIPPEAVLARVRQLISPNSPLAGEN